MKAYKAAPWVLRRFVPDAKDPDASKARGELSAFKHQMMEHVPPSETDGSLGYGNPDIEVRDIARAFCDAVAKKFDHFIPVYRRHSHLLPTESTRLFNEIAKRIEERRMQWANRIRRKDIQVAGRDYQTAALEFHFHRLAIEAIDFELQRKMGHEPSGLDLALHFRDLKDGASGNG